MRTFSLTRSIILHRFVFSDLQQVLQHSQMRICHTLGINDMILSRWVGGCGWFALHSFYLSSLYCACGEMQLIRQLHFWRTFYFTFLQGVWCSIGLSDRPTTEKGSRCGSNKLSCHVCVCLLLSVQVLSIFSWRDLISDDQAESLCLCRIKSTPVSCRRSDMDRAHIWHK